MQDEIESYREKLRYLKQNLKKISIKNLLNTNTKQKYDDVFYIDSGEIVLDDFSCALSDLILLQGKLFITDKKLVFYSWFNNTTLFGKTIMEIPLTDIIYLDKKYNLIFDNSIIVKTNKTELFLTSFIQRDKCFKKIFSLLEKQGILKLEKPLSNINSENTSVNQDNIPLDVAVCDPINIDEKNSISGNNISLSKDSIHMKELYNPVSQINESNFFFKLSEIHKERMDMLEIKENTRIKLHKNFVSNILKDENLGDIPLPLIFKYIYNPSIINTDFERGKNFICSIYENRNDYNINFEDTKKDSFPQYFNDQEYLTEFYTEIKQEKLNQFIENIKVWPLLAEFEYKYVHPVKKVFMGPDKLNINEKYCIYFISPLCFIVDVYSFFSGFMLMDTFYSVLQYKYDSEIEYSEKEKRFIHSTKLTVNLGLEFLKPNFMKSRVENESKKENDVYVKETILPNILKVIPNLTKQFFESCSRINLKNELNPHVNSDKNSNAKNQNKINYTLTREQNFSIIQIIDQNLIACKFF